MRTWTAWRADGAARLRGFAAPSANRIPPSPISLTCRFEEDTAAKEKVMNEQQTLLAAWYNLEPKLDHEARMSRGKPLCVGPTARLAENLTWEALAEMSADNIREKSVFPYPSLLHLKVHPDLYSSDRKKTGSVAVELRRLKSLIVETDAFAFICRQC